VLRCASFGRSVRPVQADQTGRRSIQRGSERRILGWPRRTGEATQALASYLAQGLRAARQAATVMTGHGERQSLSVSNLWGGNPHSDLLPPPLRSNAATSASICSKTQGPAASGRFRRTNADRKSEGETLQ